MLLSYGFRQRIFSFIVLAVSALSYFMPIYGVRADEGSGKNAPLWKPVTDEPYLQEIGEKVLTNQPVKTIAVYNKSVYAVVGNVLSFLKQGKLDSLADAPKNINRLKTLNGALWALSEGGIYRYTGSSWNLVDNRPCVDCCQHLGEIYAATKEEIFRYASGKFVSTKPLHGYLSNDSTLVMEDFSQVIADPIQIGPITQIASYSGTLYLLRPAGLALLDGETLQPDPIDWGHVPSPVIRTLMPQGSRLYLATDHGLGVIRGMAATSITGSDGLPYEDLTCMTEGFDGDVWIGTTHGAIRKTGNGYHYFGASQWLPDDNVRDITSADHTVYIATNGGLAMIHYEPYTLLKKAAFYEHELDDWGFKRLGFIHTLYWSGDKDGWIREISDNDGGNSAHYLAAMSFKYAATGDEHARQEAVKTFNALAWLGTITGKPGFIARSIWSVKSDKGKMSNRGSGGLPAKWYPTKDGLWVWKGDTSSDEVDGHFYGVSIFHDLAAKGAEKTRARDHLAHIATHIIDHGWVLQDMDGKPTRWGRWDPDYLQRPYGFEARGLNAMEAITFMHTAFAFTGDAQFEKGLQQLMKWRYHTYVWRQKVTFPPSSMVTWDDELAFRCYYPLLKYTTDPELRSIYLRSLERTWEVLRMQRLPCFNFVYGALTGNDCEAPEAVQSLRDLSLDLVDYSFKNSHRSDLAPRKDYTPYGVGTRAFSPRETGADWGSGSTLRVDGGNEGRTVRPPMAWLEDYWMGRYYGMIKPPSSKDKSLLTPKIPIETRRVAKPYDGPEPVF